MGDKATLDSVMDYLKKFQTQVTDEIQVSKKETINLGANVKSLDKKIEDLNDNINRRIDETNENMSKNKEATAEIFKRMDARMTQIEDQMKVSTKLRSESNNLRTLLKVQPNGSDATKENTEKSNSPSQHSEISESTLPMMANVTTPAEITDDEMPPAKQPEIETHQNFSSSWAKEVASQLKLAADKMLKPKYRNIRQIDEKIEQIRKKNYTRTEVIPAGRITKDSNHRKSKSDMKSIKRWFGDDSSSDENSDTSTDNENDNWEGQINRSEKNKLKKSKQKKKKDDMVANAANKARHIIGLGPISNQSIEFHRKKTGGNYANAKKEAVKEYLSYFLNFSNEEIEEISIEETAVSSKGDNTVYVALTNLEDIHEIHVRVANCRNPAIATRNFIPPQFYGMYMHISRACSTLRSENTNLKTQLRFGSRGLELHTKERDESGPFRKAKTGRLPRCYKNSSI